jgi:hypothetical protein
MNDYQVFETHVAEQARRLQDAKRLQAEGDGRAFEATIAKENARMATEGNAEAARRAVEKAEQDAALAAQETADAVLAWKAKEQKLQREIDSQDELRQIENELGQLSRQVFVQRMLDVNGSVLQRIQHLQTLQSLWPSRLSYLGEKLKETKTERQNAERRAKEAAKRFAEAHKAATPFFQRAKESVAEFIGR